ncbi:MAG: hypothetical protein JHC61_04430 [Burkholderiaceae bacterium]|nr:hypothetical protein [Burkholderiaceae bacterium]
MTSRTPVRWGRLGLSLANTLLCVLPALATSGNQADVQLQTDLSHMVIRVDQTAPMPLGGCTGDHTWHTIYGGCRRQETRSETSACTDGWSGTRTRYRTAYVLQADANDVAYEEWGPWQENCTPPRLDGVVDAVIAKVRGGETGAWLGYPGNSIRNPNRTDEWIRNPGLPINIDRDMYVGYGTLYGVTIHGPTATLNCIYASGTTTSHGDQGSQLWSGLLMPPHQSVVQERSGHCKLSNDGQSAELYGNCDSSTGGDNGGCVAATRTVRIMATSACTVTTETLESNRPTVTNSFDLCQ